MRSLWSLSFTLGIPAFVIAACGGVTPLEETSSSDGGAGASGTSGATGGSGGAISFDASAAVTTTGAGGSEEVDILEQLEAIPGAAVTEDVSEIDGYRLFYIDFDQPVDHMHPEGQHFTQRLVLHHRDAKAPFVLSSTGYYLWLPYQYLEEPAALLNANQVVVEHRYFYPSRPDPADWSLLNIWQAATDHHRIAEALHPIYQGKWISTGASKGGMTSVYHRRFYPGDVDGTVAYVAPHTGVIDDPRYVDFLNQVGDEPCRQKLRDFQREVLLRRGAMMARMEDQASANGLAFELNGVEATLESNVISVAFAFWQYYGKDRCKDIPGAADTDDAVWGFFDEIAAPLTSTDPYVLAFEPYYWQAGNQLGTPAIDTEHLKDLLLVDFTTIDDFPSVDAEPVFDPAPMQDVGAWLGSEGSEMLFIYGSDDPWSSAQFELGGAKDSYKFIMPGGNHAANIQGLTPADKATAFAALSSWAGVPLSFQQKAMSPRPSPPPFRVMRRVKTH